MELTETVIDAPKTIKPKVLELRGVTLKTKSDRKTILSNVTLTLRAGELMIWQLDYSQRSRDIASMIQGLQLPIAGDVEFEGSAWKGSDFDRHFRMRSRIGRVFEDQAWIANLNVFENVMLASDHHGIDRQKSMQSLQALAQQFSVDALSRERPAFVEAPRLQRYQWVRALMGNPSLLLLERPMQSVDQTWLPKLVSAVNDARAGGSAVLWFTSDVTEINEPILKPASRFRLGDA